MFLQRSGRQLFKSYNVHSLVCESFWFLICFVYSFTLKMVKVTQIFSNIRRGGDPILSPLFKIVGFPVVSPHTQ